LFLCAEEVELAQTSDSRCERLEAVGSDQADREKADDGEPSRFDPKDGGKDENVHRTRGAEEFNLRLAVSLLVAAGAWSALVYPLAVLVP
jgi:hypothetical protein